MSQLDHTAGSGLNAPTCSLGFLFCERREIMRVQGNIKNAWEELNQNPPNVEAAKRCLQYANTQSKVLMNESDEEGLILGSPATYPSRYGS